LLVFPRDFNRISATDANSSAGCHNLPTVGSGGDIVIPKDREIERAVKAGERLFKTIGCAGCHVPIPSFPLNNRGWIYVEPNAYSPQAT